MRIPENFLDYLKAHKHCDRRLVDYAKGLAPEELEVSTDPRGIRIRKMVYAVGREMHQMKGFVRLAPLDDSVLYGFMSPQHRIGFWVSDFLARRFPGTIIVLGDRKESWVSFYAEKGLARSKGEGIEETLDQIREVLEVENVGCDAERLWDTYYSSQYCPDRRNKRLFGQHMPVRSLRSAGLKTESRSDNAKLSDYF